MCYLQLGLCSGPSLLCEASPCLPGKALLVLGRSFLSRPSIYTQPGFGAGCQASIHFTYRLCAPPAWGETGPRNCLLDFAGGGFLSTCWVGSLWNSVWAGVLSYSAWAAVFNKGSSNFAGALVRKLCWSRSLEHLWNSAEAGVSSSCITLLKLESQALV